MRLFLILIFAISFPATAQVYKWTDENGVTHFGQQPPPGQAEEVDTRPAGGSSGSGAESDIIRQARELERKKRAQKAARARENYREKVSDIRSRSDDRPDYICTGAKDRLRSIQERWESKKRQGWSISEERYYKQRIKDAERHKSNVCR